MDGGDNLLRVSGYRHQRRRREAILPDKCHHAHLVGVGRVFDIAHLVKVGVEPPGSGDARVQVAQRAGGGVAGVFKGLLRGLVVALEFA